MPSTYIQDLLSVIDHTLYSIIDTGSNTNTTYNFFANTISVAGKNRTNLTIANQLPKNWIRFVVYGLGLKVYGAKSLNDLVQFFRDSYYSFKVAEHELKFGHLSEFLHTNAVLISDKTIGADTFQVSFKVGEGSGIYEGLIQGLEIEITSGKTFSFEIVCTSDIAGMRDTLIGVFLKGKLERMIAG